MPKGSVVEEIDQALSFGRPLAGPLPFVAADRAIADVGDPVVVALVQQMEMVLQAQLDVRIPGEQFVEHPWLPIV